MDYYRLSQTELFSGISPEETETMLSCLGASEKHYHRNETIFHTGETVRSLGIVLSGSVLIENDDVWGNHSILDRAGEGRIFAESYACVPGEKLLVTVTAAEDSDILFLDISRILGICPQTCSHHTKLIRNLLTVSARKNLHLSRRIFHTSPKNIRGRLLSYLSYQAVQNGSGEFDISFNRQQLADYLGVDRSAMSAELGKMQRDGLLAVQKNHFRLFTPYEET